MDLQDERLRHLEMCARFSMETLATLTEAMAEAGTLSLERATRIRSGAFNLGSPYVPQHSAEWVRAATQRFSHVEASLRPDDPE